MAELLENRGEKAYQSLLQQLHIVGFVRVLCLSREIECFAAVFMFLGLLEKQLVKYEVIWEANEGSETGDFEVLIGPGPKIKNGAIITDVPVKAGGGVIVINEERLERAMFKLGKYSGHLSSDLLWGICISLYADPERPERSLWSGCVRSSIGLDESSEGRGESEDELSESKGDVHELGGLRTGTPFIREIEVEIERLGQQQSEKRMIEITREIYFPFGQWLTLYESLSLDMGTIEDLGLFFRRKAHSSRALSQSEYALNQFLAKLGVSVAAAQSASVHNLVGPVQKIIQRAIQPRSVYVRHYEYNLRVSQVEAFFAICGLVRKKKYIEALFAFRDTKHLNTSLGQQVYRRMIQSIKDGFAQRKVLRHDELDVVLIPKGALTFKSMDEISIMKEVFVNICRLCRYKAPQKQTIMVAYAEEQSTYRVFYQTAEPIIWVDTKEERLLEQIKEVVQQLESAI
ncbi:hypothetical protein NEHOM01_0422 [Nematocida homosporus]|uniref:uncharacterized protein n=1 Tax=Nematocida homosporus TaxID=1912981 RepID=UPI002220AF03|nr:uncharacterized protein NEHOM01_0422 [Nematocida homosporus]KAI5184820.1 hypothetical protein NEHOM01_0422 [Nematocida homosporus]